MCPSGVSLRTGLPLKRLDEDGWQRIEEGVRNAHSPVDSDRPPDRRSLADRPEFGDGNVPPTDDYRLPALHSIQIGRQTGLRIGYVHLRQALIVDPLDGNPCRFNLGISRKGRGFAPRKGLPILPSGVPLTLRGPDHILDSRSKAYSTSTSGSSGRRSFQKRRLAMALR